MFYFPPEIWILVVAIAIVMLISRASNKATKSVERYVVDAAESEKKHAEYQRKIQKGYNSFLSNPNVSDERKQAFIRKRKRRENQAVLYTIGGAALFIVVCLLLGILMAQIV